MRTLRLTLALVFVAWPFTAFIKLMALVHSPVIYLASLIGLEDKAHNAYAITGIKLYYWMVRAREGKEAAQMAVICMVMESMMGECDHG